jgi:hypothetical protein
MLPRSFLALVIASSGCGLTSGTSDSQAVGNCPASPAPALFQNALCLCGDLNEVGASIATHLANGNAASVGVNGRSNVVGFDDVEGSWASYMGMFGTGKAHVRDDLSTTGDLVGVGALDVGGDLSVGGDLRGVGELSVGGTLRVAGQHATLGFGQVKATGPYTAPAGPPCPCDGSTFLDVAAAVTKAKTQNDNAKAGLPTSVANIGLTKVHLPTGSYYFDHVETIGATHFVADGVVALYLDGSLDAVGAEWIEISPTATLDLYVSGQVRTVGALAVGSDPSALRLYVGGKDAAVLSVGFQAIAGMIYAPTATVAFVGDTNIHGALFAKDLEGVGLFTIDYSAAQAPTPSQCTPPGSGTNGTGGTAGGTNGGMSGNPPVM